MAMFLSWCASFQVREDQVAAMYQPIRRLLSPKVETDLAHLLSAREGTVGPWEQDQ